MIEPFWPEGDEIAEDTAVEEATLLRLVTRLNEIYAVVSEGGSVLVFRRQHEPVLKRQVIVRMTFASFKNLLMNKRLTVQTKNGPLTKTYAEWWLPHAVRRTYQDGIVFDPTGKAGPTYFNLWNGFAVTPQAGDWSLIRQHILKVLCGGNEDHFRYFMGWLARMFQHPELPGEVAVILRSELRGAGKGVFMRCLHRALGQHYMHVSDPEHLIGRFNAHLQDCVCLFADESHYAGDRKHQGALQRLITEPFLAIEKKFQDVITAPNFIHLVIASNFNWVVPVATIGERRYFVPVVDEAHAQDRAYFSAIVRQMDNRGIEAMLHDLLAHDISNFDVRDIPESKGLTEQKIHSLDSVGKWWLEILSRGFLYRSKFGTPLFSSWGCIYSTEMLWKSYLQWCDDTREPRRQSREQMGKTLSSFGYQWTRPRRAQPIGEVAQLTSDRRDQISLDTEAVISAVNQPGYTVGDIVEARDKFTIATKIAGDWGQIEPGEDDE